LSWHCVHQYLDDHEHMRRLNKYKNSLDDGGNIIVYIIVVMMLFAALGAALVSIYTTSNLTAVIGDDAKQAGYLAESGVRYAIAELKADYTRAAIQFINATTYTMSDGDAFDVNIFPKWFLAASTVSLTTGQTIDLNVPDNATIPEDFEISAGVYLININSLRDAIAFGGDQTRFIAEVNADSVDVDDDTLRVEIKDSFEAGENQPIHMGIYPNAAAYPSEQAIPVDGSGDLVVGLDDPVLAETIFHQDGGTFYVLNPSTGARRMYAYDAYTTASPVTLKNIRGVASLSVDAARDIIIFSDKNHLVTAQGTTGPSTSQATGDSGIEMPQNTSTAPIWAPETAEETPPDVDMTSILQTAATPASTPGAVTIDTVNKEIKLGLNVSSAFSAVWYGGTQNVGGLAQNFCSSGKCRFEYGMRAYFAVDYTGTGDGFTFALANGTDNTLGSVGGQGGAGELLGYAGPGTDGNGIQEPKLALEFDTYTNTGRNDPGGSNKDYLNFVYWGVDDSDLNDDNVHDTWASISTTNGNIRSTPFVENSGDILLVTDNGYLYRMNVRGETDDTFYLQASSDSSPVKDNAGRIWVGTNDGYINAVNSGLSFFINPQTRNVGGDVRTIPAIDAASGRVFFGTDYTGGASLSRCNFCSMSLTGTLYSSFLYTSDVIRGSPFIRGASVYFGGNQGGGDIWSFTLTGSDNWGAPFTTTSDVLVSPIVSTGGRIYFGSWYNDSYFYCVSTAKVEQWRFDTGLVAVYSTAALDESRRRVYFGTGEKQSGGDDGKVYALDMDTGALAWSYQTGGAIYSSPVVGADGAVTIGANDGYLYCFEPDGDLRWQIDLKDDVRSSPALSNAGTVPYVAYVGSDENRLYSIPVTGNPWQFKTWEDDISGTTEYRYLTYGNDTYPDPDNNLPPDAYTSGTIASADNWLNSGPWAVRVEVDRSIDDPDGDGMYAYTIRSWIRQCQQADCSDITGTFFSDTRIAYQAKPAQMEQTFELSGKLPDDDHWKFETYYNGFTQASGSATQTVTIRNIRIGFVRPGDFIVTADPNWN
jgi:outer membrane protein assembly factor BamB